MVFLVNLLVVVQILSAIGMIGLVLVQHGKGADMGAAVGSGSSGSLFGASGSANFLSRSTAILAAVFFVATLALAYFGSARKPASSGSVLEQGSVLAPAPAASGAALIPGAGSASSSPAPGAPAVAPATAPAPAPAPAIGASGANQIPTK